MMKAALVILAIALFSGACQGFVATPLVGYQQGVTLKIDPPSAGSNSQCLVYGVPTPSGYADQAPTPLFLNTPQNTGTHVLQFLFDSSKYSLSPFLAPGQTTLQIDASDATNPLISFNATNSPVGQSGAVTIYMTYNKAGGLFLCEAQIQFTVDPALDCLPKWGGVNSGPPSNNGQFVIPSGSVYAPTFVSQTIIQKFVTVNNININQVIVNVNQITNTNVINNIIINPPAPAPPAPVNCTKTPSDPSCKTTPPKPAPHPAPSPKCIDVHDPWACFPSPPPPAPTPRSAPTVHPTTIPVPPRQSPPVPVPTSQPTIVATPPTIVTPTPTVTVNAQPPQQIYTQTTPSPTRVSSQPPTSDETVITYVNPPAESQSMSQATPPTAFTQSFGRRL